MNSLWSAFRSSSLPHDLFLCLEVPGTGRAAGVVSLSIQRHLRTLGLHFKYDTADGAPDQITDFCAGLMANFLFVDFSVKSTGLLATTHLGIKKHRKIAPRWTNAGLLLASHCFARG